MLEYAREVLGLRHRPFRSRLRDWRVWLPAWEYSARRPCAYRSEGRFEIAAAIAI